MTVDSPFKDFGTFLRERFPNYKLQKISVDAGFTCPNRDGTKGYGGCSYCNNAAFTPEYCGKTKSVSDQIIEGKEIFSRKYSSMHYLAYFQSYTGTYADVDTAVSLYREALSIADVEGIIIATRPDCVSDELLNCLLELAQDKFLLVEYGAESCNNDTLVRVNRCHTWEDTVDAVYRTTSKGILCGLHLILGLPGEGREELLHNAEIISTLPITTLKLHQLQIIRGTRLAKDFLENNVSVSPYDIEDYISLAIDFIERISPSIVLDRFVSQSPDNLLIAPRWGVKNYEFTTRLVKEMQRRGAFQGRLFDN